jgi:hypothetical protein
MEVAVVVCYSERWCSPAMSSKCSLLAAEVYKSTHSWHVDPVLCCCLCTLTEVSSSGTGVSDADTWLTARLPKLLLQDVAVDTDVTDDALNDWCDTFIMKLNSVALSTKLFTVVDADSKAMCFKLVLLLQLLTLFGTQSCMQLHSVSQLHTLDPLMLSTLRLGLSSSV